MIEIPITITCDGCGDSHEAVVELKQFPIMGQHFYAFDKEALELAAFAIKGMKVATDYGDLCLKCKKDREYSIGYRL